MTLAALTRSWAKLPLIAELTTKLQQHQFLHLTGISRLVKGLASSTVTQAWMKIGFHQDKIVILKNLS